MKDSTPTANRLFVGFLGVATAALVTLGLYNAWRGFDRPENTESDITEQARSAEAATEVAQTDPGLQQFRAAIGCPLPSPGEPDPGALARAYRWRDSAGVMNFSDSAPGEIPAAGLWVENSPEEFYISVASDNAILPANIEGQIRAGAKRTYDQWRDWLGSDNITRSHINIRFIGSADRFQDIYGKPDGENWTATGFYRIQSNEAVVLYTPRYRASALSTAFHEASHLITAWHLGVTPPWLNEGIAEHFETMNVAWQGAGFSDNRRHLALLERRGPLSLRELIALKTRDWTSEDAERRYASAWALVTFLMDSDTGSRVLAKMLNTAHQQRCSATVNSAEELANYPGGLRVLEQDWLRWLARRYSARSA